MRKRKFKRFLKNGVLYLTLTMAIIVYVVCAMRFAMTNLLATLGLLVSGMYILMFCWANEVM